MLYKKHGRHTLARMISKLSFAAGVIASFAFPVLAQNATGSMPDNACLCNASHGAAWTCERGFVKIADRCDAIAVPENAFLDQASYGSGWSCELGYQPLSSNCISIDLPQNAHLDRSGNWWSCNRGFQLSDGAFVLGR